MSEINIDAEMLNNSEASLSRTEEKLVEMSNGCICCTLREDLLDEIEGLAQQNKFDYLVIESTGISEPLPIAETFTFEDEEGRTLSSVARLDTMVTVVDAFNFLKDYQSIDELKDRNLELGEEDERSISHLLIEQVEFANVLLFNKTDLVSEEDIKRLHGIIRSLNRDAKIINTSRSTVSLDEILNTHMFDFEKASESPGWLKVMRGEENSEIDEYGVSSISFVAQKPFHPERLYDFLNTGLAGLYRAKGYFWIASQPNFMADMSIAGSVLEYQPVGFWWASMPEEEWPEDEATRVEIKNGWHPQFGDRFQRLIFIGKPDALKNIESELEKSLLTDDEIQKGIEYYQQLSDPFGDWNQYLPTYDENAPAE